MLTSLLPAILTMQNLPVWGELGTALQVCSPLAAASPPAPPAEPSSHPDPPGQLGWALGQP